ncbi:MAG TPA: cystathionine beta-lyase [Caulobacteraceae bacterium]|jgi:cystathionine beta-lyase
MEERTRLIRQATRRTGAAARPLNPPMERATTLLMPDAAALYDAERGPLYGIDGLGVHAALREALAELEGASEVALLPTGLAAVAVAVMAAAGAGDEVLAADALYGPTRRLLDRTLKRFGIAVRYYPPRASAEEVLALAGERTRLILLESPGSLTFEVQDVPAIAGLARERGIATLADNSWAAGVFFKPLTRGVDLSVQALSKYAGGAADVFMGSVATSDAATARRVRGVVEDMGWYVSPDDAYLMLRGVRTLPVRLREHERSALQVARWLEAQPEVAAVLHPALPSSPDHALWRRDFTGSSGLFGVVLRPGRTGAAEAVLDTLELFGLGFSWGGYESLAIVSRPGVRTHGSGPEGPLLRLHVGLEAPEDLIADLRRGLDVYARA